MRALRHCCCCCLLLLIVSPIRKYCFKMDIIMDHDYCGKGNLNGESLVDTNRCEICQKVYKLKKCLEFHRSKVHGLQSNLLTNNRVCCLEPNCDERFAKINKLERHLVHVHNKKMEIKIIIFSSMEDFHAWKSDYEIKNCTRFASSSGGDSRKLFLCNRTGNYKPMGKGIRKLKSRGSCRSGNYCTARISLKINNEKISARVCFTHYGHELELGHLKMSKEDRKNIATQLMRGVPEEHLIKSGRNSANGTSRLDLLTRKDICNIRKSLGLKDSEADEHVNSRKRALAWLTAEERKTHNRSLILFKDEKEGETANFALAIMTDHQAVLARRFTNTAVAIDETNFSNSSQLNLLTLIGFDENAKAFPLAFSVAYHSSQKVIEAFFYAVKKKCGGPLNTQTFISNDSDQYFTAWENVMGQGAQKLLSSWNVYTTWQNQLNSLAMDSQQKQLIEKSLKMIQTTTDQQDFVNMLNEFLADMNNGTETKQFLQDFQKNYIDCEGRCEQWAHCFRNELVLNSLPSLETLHAKIENYNLKNRKSGKLDKTIHALMELLKNTEISRVIELHKGINPSSTDWHKTSLLFNFQNVLQSGSEWYVTSNLYKTTEVVSRIRPLNHAKRQCVIKCVPCGICEHLLSCTCATYVVQGAMCEHIHLIGRYITKDPHSDPVGRSDSPISFFKYSLINEEIEAISHLLPDDGLQQKKDQLKKLTNNILLGVEKMNEETLRLIIPHMERLQAFMFQ